ncbi:uncharacterized protein A4U43_C10F10700 [Asparagus officinalis]|uniref:Uncharacterized protein n=1 Tax=Asparagus officinalis TaxID=4686 RepID=A0A5P1E1X9_ASPOF|nr:uncharacterized protein A4U43_C10F10700 [Asparagus officinalis]
MVSDETPARHSLVYRGLIPLLAEGSAKATDSESTEVILQAALRTAVDKKLVKVGDAVVALHRIGAASVIKICIVKIEGLLNLNIQPPLKNGLPMQIQIESKMRCEIS